MAKFCQIWSHWSNGGIFLFLFLFHSSRSFVSSFLASLDGWPSETSALVYISNIKRGQWHFLLTSRVTRWWNKKLPNFHKNAPKVALHFLHKSDIIISSPRSHQNIWATFYWDNMLPRTCKTGPTWSLCSLVNELELLLKQILLLQDDKFSPKRRSFDWMDAVLTICWSTLPFQEGC